MRRACFPISKHAHVVNNTIKIISPTQLELIDQYAVRMRKSLEINSLNSNPISHHSAPRGEALFIRMTRVEPYTPTVLARQLSAYDIHVFGSHEN